MPCWSQVVFVHNTCASSYHATMGLILSSKNPCSAFDSTSSFFWHYRTVSEQKLWRKHDSPLARTNGSYEWKSRTSIIAALWHEGRVSVRSVGCIHLCNAQYNLQHGRKCSDKNTQPIISRLAKCSYYFANPLATLHGNHFLGHTHLKPQ